MSDLKDRQFIRDEAEPMVRKVVPSILEKITDLMSKINQLVIRVGVLEDIENTRKNNIPVVKPEPEKKAESAPKKRLRKKKVK